MRKFFALTAVFFLTACNDGVPAISDPHHIVVDGTKMTQDEFLVKYCATNPKAVNNETCAKVRHAASIDSTNRGIPRF